MTEDILKCLSQEERAEYDRISSKGMDVVEDEKTVIHDTLLFIELLDKVHSDLSKRIKAGEDDLEGESRLILGRIHDLRACLEGKDEVINEIQRDYHTTGEKRG